MLQEFLKKIGTVTGKTYSKAEFKQILTEALADEKKEVETTSEAATGKEKKTK